MPAAALVTRRLIEWPTLALLAFVYGGFTLLLLNAATLPVWFTTPVGAVLIAWHSSLQHEILHGHPTRWRHVNRALAVPPLSLWLPYELYRRSHLVHHRDERLTDPLDDPESRYWSPEAWRALGPLGRFVVRLQGSFAGRMLIGPAWTAGRFLWQEARALAGGDRRHATIWLSHAAGVTLVLLFVSDVCGLSVWYYVFGIVYPGTSLLLIRSFAEHRAAEGVFERTAIVENARFLGPLFLFNNLHAAHHAEPMLPWYEIPAWYRAHRDRLIAENGGLVYDSYLDVMRRYLFRWHDRPEHPLGRAPFADGSRP